MGGEPRLLALDPFQNGLRRLPAPGTEFAVDDPQTGARRFAAAVPQICAAKDGLVLVGLAHDDLLEQFQNQVPGIRGQLAEQARQDTGGPWRGTGPEQGRRGPRL